MYNNNFWDVDWGPDEAKNDHNLEKYFVELPDYSKIIQGQLRYIIGRKGTGKTAILEKIRIDAEHNHKCLVSNLSFKSFPLALLRKLRDKSYTDKSQYVPAWSFLILIDLARLICRDESAQNTQALLELRRFLRDNKLNGLSFADTVNHLDSTSNKIIIPTSWLGVSDQCTSSKEHVSEIHYQKASEALINIIDGISSKVTYFVLFDELDEGFKAGDTNIRLFLLALLRAVENLALHFSKDNLTFRPVVALRSDIFDRLEDNDINKLDDYVLRLIWTTESRSSYKLIDVVNKRIYASFPTDPSKGDAWSNISINNDQKLPSQVKSLWDFIYNRTFERPRDIIKYMKCCQKLSGKGPINFDVVQTADMKYSNWFYDELRDEIHTHLPIWREALECISRVGHGVMELRELTQQFENEPKIKQYLKDEHKDNIDIIKTLFEFSAIGNYGSDRWIFKYKDSSLPFDATKKIIVHFGLTKKLRIKTFRS